MATLEINPVKDIKGEAWEYKCEPGRNLKKIFVSHSPWAVDFLQFVAVDRETSEVFLSDKYGGEAGTNFDVIELGVDEYIKSVSGQQQCYDATKGKQILYSIMFSTNRTTYGPFGSQPYNATTGASGYAATQGGYGRGRAYAAATQGGYGYGTSQYDDTAGAFGRQTYATAPGGFHFEMGQSFGGFHGSVEDGHIQSFGVFIKAE